MFRFSPAAAAALLAFLLIPNTARTAAPDSAPDILSELRAFREMGSVLLVAAHPDDEDSNLIAFLARGRNCRIAYLSVTRGDGGQNLLGPEIGDELGVIRTQELLAARRVDGGQQFFTRARDFGYSKDYRETFRFWGEQEVLSDVVRVIRTFRPDVVIAVFSTNPAPGQHGHHTGSAILAGEAFKLAGDPKAFPEQLTTLQPWQPKRMLQDRGRSFTMEVPAEYGVIAGNSRSQHKTQGFGNFAGRGGGGTGTLGFTYLAGDRATNDIFDGVDTTWGRVPGGAAIGPMTDDVIAHFDAAKPSASVPALVAIHHLLASLPADRILDEKRLHLVHILQECLGLTVETTVPGTDSVPFEIIELHHTISLRGELPVRYLGTHYYQGPESSLMIDASGGRSRQVPRPTAIAIDLAPGQTTNRVERHMLFGAGASLTTPYYLRENGSVGLFKVSDPSLIGLPENPPNYPMEHIFQVLGETFVIPDEPIQFIHDPVKGDIPHTLWITPPVSLKFIDDVELFPPGASRPAVVEITGERDKTVGSLRLVVPSGWQVAPAAQPFSISKSGGTARLSFNITAPSQTGTGEIEANATVGNFTWKTGRVILRYDHIPPQLLQPVASLKAVSLQMAVNAHKVGYVPGAGDDIAEALTRMGCEVTQLASADLTPDKLRGLDTVVTGVRAFNVHPELAQHMGALAEFATNGGNVIVLYNRPGGGGGRGGSTILHLGPDSVNVSGDRVTDETAEMTLLVPDHPVFNTPNKIVPADFDGWIQERGAYFANQWDPNFKPLIACHDPGEEALKGSLLVADCGRGHFVYTALSWFRQLPDGVPGAYRLFANLVSLGK